MAENKDPDTTTKTLAEEETPRKTTKRTPRSKKTAPDASETLKDTQQVNEQATESLGSQASPGNLLYQTSQFRTDGYESVLKHLANPSEAALKAEKASTAGQDPDGGEG